MESKWRLNHWILGLGDDSGALYARLLDFAFPFYIRWANPASRLYDVCHVTVQPGEVSDFPLYLIVDGTFEAPAGLRFPFGFNVEPDH